MKQMYELKNYSLEDLLALFKEFRSYRNSYSKKWDLVKKFHDGDMWAEVGKGLPNFYIKNDTNYLEYIEKSIKNSVYTGDFKATALPRSLEDNEIATKLNRFIDMTWDNLKFKDMIPVLGKNTILYNLSYVRVEWDSGAIKGKKGKLTQGAVGLKQLQPKEVYLDPSHSKLQDGQALFIVNQVNLNVLRKLDHLKEGLERYLKELEKTGIKEGEIPASDYIPEDSKKAYSSKSKTITVMEAFYKTKSGIDQIYIANGEYIIGFKENIKPNKFPIVALYGELPSVGPYGLSMANKVLYNIIAYNMITTLESTYIYSSQNRSKLITSSSGLNYRSFTKFGNDPHKAWVVQGDPSQVVRYIDIPELPNFIHMTKETIRNDIMMVTGVDLRYTGRDTGSIQTTGGTDLSQQRIIGQTDNARISSMESFVEELTELVINYYSEHGGKYPIFKRNKTSGKIIDSGEQEEIVFNDIKDLEFQFSLDAAPQLPKNKLRIAQAATELMESQAQYQFPVQLISAEEWLSYQDFPQKELILDRIRSEAQSNDEQQLVNDLLNFAGLIERGMEPQEAIQIIVDEKNYLRENPDIDANTKG